MNNALRKFELYLWIFLLFLISIFWLAQPLAGYPASRTLAKADIYNLLLIGIGIILILVAIFTYWKFQFLSAIQKKIGIIALIIVETLVISGVVYNSLKYY